MCVIKLDDMAPDVSECRLPLGGIQRNIMRVVSGAEKFCNVSARDSWSDSLGTDFMHLYLVLVGNTSLITWYDDTVVFVADVMIWSGTLTKSETGRKGRAGHGGMRSPRRRSRMLVWHSVWRVSCWLGRRSRMLLRHSVWRDSCWLGRRSRMLLRHSVRRDCCWLGWKDILISRLGWHGCCCAGWMA